MGGISKELVLLFGRSFLMVKDSYPDQAMLFIRSLLKAITITEYNHMKTIYTPPIGTGS